MDEDIYIRKALRASEGLPLEADKTNPIYGWLFLSVALKAVGYPDSLHPSADGDASSIEMLYLIPRIFIAILAIIDTFLIFKISEYHFRDRKVALIASILFAVMPMTWLTRYVLLENIQLPFLLSSVLFALYLRVSGNTTNQHKIRSTLPMVLFSGICFGSAIFIKIPAFAMIPVIGFIIYTSSKSVKMLAVWFIPVLLVPLISPVYANYLGMFTIWKDGIFYHINRGNVPFFDLTGQDPANAINALLRIDPVLLVIGIISIIFITVRRDFLVLLWTVPYIILFYFIGYVSFYYYIPLFPALCIAFAKLTVDASNKFKNKNVKQILPFVIISGFGIFGLISTTLLITTNINSTHFQAAAIIAHHLPNIENSKSHEDRITVIMGQSRFFWILKNVFHKDHYYTTYSNVKVPINKTRGVLLIIEHDYDYWKRTDQTNRREELLNLYNNSKTVLVLNNNTDIYDVTKYPFTSMSVWNLGIGRVELRVNTAATNLFLDLLNHGR